MTPYLTAALYKFVELPDFAGLQVPLLERCQQHRIKGTFLLAAEGINGTIAGKPDDVHAVLAYLRSDERLATLEHKESWASAMPFYRMKVRLKKEIVTLGVPDVHPALMTGQYIKPESWNELIEQPGVVLVDTRNDYEVSIGTFAGAVNPATASFSELPAWVDAQMQPGGRLAEVDGVKPKVAMFCTGGIRCEKSTAFLKSRGFGDVYHLEGGILKYLETVPEAQSQWQGQCFVFDERVSVGHGLVQGNLELCRSCRDPITAQAMASPFYERGVSCPGCHGSTTNVQKAGYRQRQKQVDLADARLQAHIGAVQSSSQKQ